MTMEGFTTILHDFTILKWKKKVIVTCCAGKRKSSLQNLQNHNFLYLDPASRELIEGGHLELSHGLCPNYCSENGIHQRVEDKYQIVDNRVKFLPYGDAKGLRNACIKFDAFVIIWLNNLSK